MLATGTCCCCCGAAVVLLQSNSFQSKKQLLLLLCPQRHGPPGRGNTMALKDVWSPKWTFPGAGTSLLKSPRKSLLYVSRCWLLGAAAAAGAADPSKRRLPARKLHATEGRQRLLLLLLLCPQRHGPPGRGNTMALKDQRSPKYAFPEAGTSLLKSLAIRCWLAANCCTCAVALTAAASACVCCCLLMPAAACCCLLLPAAACCWCCCWWLLLLLWCCCRAALVLLSCCCNQTASKARNSCCCCCAHKDTALPDGETPCPEGGMEYCCCCWCSWPFKRAASGKETPC